MWKSIQINKQNVIKETDHSVLIKCPHNSLYDGWVFWHPSKLVREGKNRNALSISYTENFNFKLFKYGNGKNKFKIIDEDEINYEELEDIFELINKNITEPNKGLDSYLIVEEPKKIEVVSKVQDELLND